MALWSGLGYYARARNLHRAARAVVSQHGGVIPADEEALRRLPGIGAYTAAAVAAIGFDVRAFALDGNAARVVARLLGVTEPLRPKVKADLAAWGLAEVPARRRRFQSGGDGAGRAGVHLASAALYRLSPVPALHRARARRGCRRRDSRQTAQTGTAGGPGGVRLCDARRPRAAGSTTAGAATGGDLGVAVRTAGRDGRSDSGRSRGSGRQRDSGRRGKPGLSRPGEAHLHAPRSDGGRVCVAVGTHRGGTCGRC